MIYALDKIAPGTANEDTLLYGVEVKFYNPIRLTQLWTVNYRCHDKYLIIDRSTYLMGGRNTSDLFLGSGGTSRQNIDRDIVVYNGGFTTASANTLLEYFGLSYDPIKILEREQYWKRCFDTIKNGYNDN